MPSPYVADAEIGPRILSRLRWRFPEFTVRRIASELGCSIGHAHSLLTGKVELGIGALLGLARACGDAEVLLGPELASLDLALVKLPQEGTEEWEVEVDATSEMPGKYRRAVVISRALDAAASGQLPSLSADDVEALSSQRLVLSELLHFLEARDGLRVAP